MSDFAKALMWTAIASVVLPGLIWLAGIITAIVFATRGKRSIAAGILAGVGIGIVAWGATCFALQSVFAS